MENRDPLTRREPDDEYRPLFKKILMNMPSPLGLGPGMEAMRTAYPGRAGDSMQGKYSKSE